MTLRHLGKFIVCLGVLAAASCSKETSKTEEELLKYNSSNESFKENALIDKNLTALYCTPSEPDADKPLVISFRAGKDSELYGYTGDVYAHIGLLQFGVWTYVKADWPNPEDAESMTANNKDEWKFVKDENEKNLWHLTMPVSVREFFTSEANPIGETPVTQIGLVIRSADGKSKGMEKDRFIRIKDNLYKEFEPKSIEMKPLPANCFENNKVLYGPNVVDGTSVTFVLHDKDKKGEHKDFAYIVGDFNDWKLSNNEDGTQNSEMYRDDATGCWWITVSNLDPAKEYCYQYHVGDVVEEGYDVIRISDAFSEKILDGGNDKWINYHYDIYPEDEMKFPAQGINQVSCVRINRDVYPWTDFEIKNPESLVVYEMLLGDFTKEGSLKAAMGKLDYLKTLGINAVELMPIQEFDGNESWGYNPTHYFAVDKAYGTAKDYKDFIEACHQKGIAVIIDVVYNHNTGAAPIAKLYWNPETNKTAPNNPYFNVDAPHEYSVFHDLNHDNEFVKDLVKRSLKYLIEEYNIDGFRFDLSKGFAQSGSTDGYNAGRIKIVKEYNAFIKSVDPDCYVILEHLGDKDGEETEYINDGMHPWLKMNWEYCQTAEGRNSGFTNVNKYRKGWVGYMESHDEERMSYKAKNYGVGNISSSLDARMKQLALNAVCFLTVPGPKMIWQMGELGYDYNKWCKPDGTDMTGSKEYETSRKPVKWDYLGIAERKALYDVYCKLNQLRNNNPELFGNNVIYTYDLDAWPLKTSNSKAGNKEVQIYANFAGDGAVRKDLTILGGPWRDYITGETVNNGHYGLDSGKFLVLVNSNVQ